MCPTEWESLIRAIDIGISPWLVHRSFFEEQYGDVRLTEEIYAEVNALIAQIQSFLTKCSQIENGFHLIVDEESRNYLHLFLLRKIVPLIQTRDAISIPLAYPSLAQDDATNLALAVIKSWCVVGYLPFREGDWCKRATALLSEAFALYEGTSEVLYPGGYVHCPLVRLEALKSLLHDEFDFSNYPRDSESVSTSISTVTSVSVVNGNIPFLSLFSLTRYANLRHVH